MVTLDKEGNPIMKSEVKLTYELAMGTAWHRFFEGLKEEKIWGTRCPKCNRVLVPPRPFCGRCFVDCDEWIEVSQEGVVQSWCLTEIEYFGQPTKPPFINAVIRLEGTDCGFMHLIGGFEMNNIDTVRRIVKNGMKVKAVWNEKKITGITDIKYFRPLD